MNGPSLLDVLTEVRRGRVVYLCLTTEQKRNLRDPDGSWRSRCCGTCSALEPTGATRNVSR